MKMPRRITGQLNTSAVSRRLFVNSMSVSPITKNYSRFIIIYTIQTELFPTRNIWVNAISFEAI